MKKIKVAYQGMPGAYSEQATLEFAKKNKLSFEGLPKKNFRQLFESIKKDTYIGVVPIENSTAGSVVECYDLLLEYEVEIIGEYKLAVNHCLLAKKGTKISDVEKVYSHPQALMQCAKYIEKNKWTPLSYLDTAGSAEFVSKSKDTNIASISSVIAADHYGLKVLDKGIQDKENNVTRFLLVKKKDKKFDFEKKILNKANKSTIIFETRNIPGALYKCLGAFVTQSINLTKIESRPSPVKHFDYVFYIDLEAELSDIRVKLALEELQFFSEKVKILGSYKADR